MGRLSLAVYNEEWDPEDWKSLRVKLLDTSVIEVIDTLVSAGHMKMRKDETSPGGSNLK